MKKLPILNKYAAIKKLLTLLAIFIVASAQAQINDPTKGLRVFDNKTNSISSIKRHASQRNNPGKSRTSRRRTTSKSNSRSKQTYIDYDNYSPALERRAEKGDVRAISTVAYSYLYGNGVSQDEGRARYFFDKGAAKGDVDMMVISGLLYQREGDNTTAFNRFSLAHHAGSAWGTYQLALSYINGAGTNENKSYGVTLLQSAVDKGFADAQETLGMCYMAGSDKLGIKQSTSKGQELLEKAASQNDDDALLDLGRIWLRGLYGYNTDASKAYTYLKKSADLGNGDAMDYLGDMYRYGIYVTQDKSQAFDWYAKATEAGSVDGQADLGRAYIDGELVSQNFQEGVKNLTLAANKGNINAEYGLGLCYENGNGVNKDMGIAMSMYAKAALGGMNVALSRLGLYISSFINNGKTENDWLSFELFRAAARGGESWGMFFLGRCLYEGVGHDKEKKIGIYWIRKAAEDNDQLAINYINENNIKSNSISDYQGQQILSQTTGNEQHAFEYLAQWGKDNDAVQTNIPTYRTSVTSAKITSVYRTDCVTIVSFTTKYEKDGLGFAINRNTHLVVDGNEYRLIDKEGVNFSPDWTYFDYVGQEKSLYLVFSPIPHETKSFDLIESNGADQWQFYNIECIPKQ